MEENIFSPIEIDAIGEIMNISLGSSATAASNMLDHRVDITTPRVSVVNAEAVWRAATSCCSSAATCGPLPTFC